MPRSLASCKEPTMSTTRTTSSRRATALLAGAASLCGILAWLVCSGDGAGMANRAALAVPDAAASAAAALATESAAPARADAEQRSGYYIAPVGTALSYVLEGHCEYSLVHPEAGRQPSGFALRAGLEV